MVKRRRRRKQYAAVCGLPLSLTLADGSTVLVRPMSEENLSQILAIRRHAETLGYQPGLGITRCLSDDDFRLEVKGVHKFAIFMISDTAEKWGPGQAEQNFGEMKELNSCEKEDRMLAADTAGRIKRKTGEEKNKLAEDLSKILHPSPTDIDTKSQVSSDACQSGDASNSLRPKMIHENETLLHLDCEVKCSNDSNVSNNCNYRTLEQNEEFHGCLQTSQISNEKLPVAQRDGEISSQNTQDDISGTVCVSGKDLPQVTPLYGQHQLMKANAYDSLCPGDQREAASSKTGRTLPSSEMLEAADSMCFEGKRSKKVSASNRTAGEHLIAAVILTDSKYYRGPSFVTPWSFVSPAYMGRGLDSLCLSISELMAKRLGYWGMYLDMLVTDLSSVALMERKAGYRRVGTLPHVEMDKDGQPVGCHIYHKELRVANSLSKDKE